jgi:hypothetical protein
MALTMTVPIVAWMRYRGHGWAADVGDERDDVRAHLRGHRLLWAGLAEGDHTLLMIQHTAMFPLMFVAMLLRRDEYAGHA